MKLGREAAQIGGERGRDGRHGYRAPMPAIDGDKQRRDAENHHSGAEH